MTAGPLVSATGLTLALRIGPGTGWGTPLLAVSVFGLGLTLTVAPLTSAVLGAASPSHAGVASGVNNAVARTAGLLAVAGLPAAAGLTDDAVGHPALFDAGYHRLILLCVGLLVAGAVIAALTTAEAPTPDAAAPHLPR